MSLKTLFIALNTTLNHTVVEQSGICCKNYC